MSQTTPRQVLYALVSAGLVMVTAVLAGGAAVAGIVPTWWTVALGVGLAAATVYLTLRWRNTAVVLLIAVGLFIVWMVGTLILAA